MNKLALVSLGLLASMSAFACGSGSGSDSTGNGNKNGTANGGTTAGPGSTPFAGGDGEGTNPGGEGEVAPGTVMPLAAGLRLTEVAIFQAVKISLEKEGEAVAKRNAPVVAGRPALLRAYVAPDDGWTNRELTGELTLFAGDEPVLTLKDKKTIGRASSEGTMATTFNFEIPADQMTPGLTYRVALREVKASVNALSDTTGAVFPSEDGSADLNALPGADLVKIVVVPVQYNADGSGRLPDTSAAQLERYRQAAYQVYPAAKVEVTARTPFPYSGAIGGTSGQSYSNILEEIVSLRLSDIQAGKADRDTYYYGAFVPKENFNTFCRSGCITGLSGLVSDPRDSTQRASVGVGYRGMEGTMIHEVGHAHGRPHAPCGGAAGVDPRWPKGTTYSQASIGVWGYDLLSKQLFAPSGSKDFMGYCDPTWISDYTYAQLFDRIVAVNGAAYMTGLTAPSPSSYRFLQVDEKGTLHWGKSITLGDTLFNEPHPVTFRDASGSAITTVTGHYYPYPDAAGGYWLVPEPGIEFHDVRLESLPAGAVMQQVIQRVF